MGSTSHISHFHLGSISPEFLVGLFAFSTFPGLLTPWIALISHNVGSFYHTHCSATAIWARIAGLFSESFFQRSYAGLQGCYTSGNYRPALSITPSSFTPSYGVNDNWPFCEGYHA